MRKRASFWGADQNVLRIHCGLEGADVLKADLENMRCPVCDKSDEKYTGGLQDMAIVFHEKERKSSTFITGKSVIL